MKGLIGIDSDIFSQISGGERALYQGATFSLAVVCLLSFLTNAYFGWMMTHDWVGVLAMSLLMGFIHFSILRIAVITMVSLPVISKPSSTETGLKSKIKSLVGLISFAGIIRFVFVGCIAISMAFPGLAMLEFNKTEALNQQRRKEVLAESMAKMNGIDKASQQLMHELNQANYPFYVFQELSKQKSNGVIVFAIGGVVFLPFILLAYLKKGPSFQYARLASKMAIQSIEMDFSRTMEESQWWMDQRYPTFSKKLMDLQPYADAPFNTQLKTAKMRQYGTPTEFQNWLKLS